MRNTLALPSGHVTDWDGTLLAFLAKKERRTGSRRTSVGYSRMLFLFFGRAGKTPTEVAGPDVFAWAYGRGLSGREPSAVTIGARIACLSSFSRFLIQMGAVEPWWITASPDADLDPLVDALQERCGQWIAAHAGDAARYGPRLITKLTVQLLQERDGVARLWRLAALHELAVQWAPAAPDAALGPMDARRLRAWLAMLRSIMPALEPGAPQSLQTLARVYLRWLRRQLPGPSPDRVATTGTVRAALERPRRPRMPQAARAAPRQRGSRDSA